jgi:inhibitor of cysteine peptidase
MISGPSDWWRSKKVWQPRCFCLVLLNVAIWSQAVKQIDESANGSTIQVLVGEILEIRLSENRTAGYKWSIRSDGSPVCRPVDDHFDSGRMGLGNKGSHYWRFQCVCDGTAKIEFEYGRPWEKEAEPVRIFSVNVKGKT